MRCVPDTGERKRDVLEQHVRHSVQRRRGEVQQRLRRGQLLHEQRLPVGTELSVGRRYLLLRRRYLRGYMRGELRWRNGVQWGLVRCMRRDQPALLRGWRLQFVELLQWRLLLRVRHRVRLRMLPWRRMRRSGDGLLQRVLQLLRGAGAGLLLGRCMQSSVLLAYRVLRMHDQQPLHGVRPAGL
jgi:hypothetical protein